MTEKYDVGVIGAGFSGLASAVILGRLGRRVVLVDASPRVGGLLRSYARRGVDCPVGVHYFGSAGEHELLGQFFRVLEVRDSLALRRMGTERTIDRYIFDEFEFDLPSGLEALESSFEGMFGRGCAGVSYVVEALRSAIRGLRIDERGRVALTSLSGEGPGKSAADILSHIGCPERLRRIISAQGFLTGADLDEVTLEVPLVSMASLLQSAWELGGTGAQMADQLLARAIAHGVEIITGDRVERIQADGDTARALHLASGRTIHATRFVSAVHPKALFQMLRADTLPEEYVRGLFRLRETPGVIGVVALADAQACPASPFNFYRMGHLLRDGVYAQVRRSDVPGYSRVLLLARSQYQDWQPWHSTRTGKRDSCYLERKRALAIELFRRVESVIGHIDTSQLVDVWTPLTLRDWTGAPEGGAYGIRRAPSDGLRYATMTRTPLTNLFQVGQSAIAPGLVGCALSVIRALGDLEGRALVREFLARELHGGRAAIAHSC